MKIPNGKLINDGGTGDGKRLFIAHTANDGFADFRIEVVTDDVDRLHAKRMAAELIRRWNSFEK